jgi:hypothetical protein
VPDEQEDGGKHSEAVQPQGEHSCFERGHQTGLVQSEEEEKQGARQAAEMAAQEEPIGVLEVFSIVPGY